MQTLQVHFLPELVRPAELAGGSCVAIDVLRATTTITAALAAGAREVIACGTIEEARARAARYAPARALLGGERGGLPIEGFDLGNSPAEYTRERVDGKTVLLTTTNGTRALLHCHLASEVFVAAVVNLAAVCQRLVERSEVHLLCAGTDGRITREDVLLAGAIAARLTAGGDWQISDSAAIARDAWLRVMAHATGGDVQARLVEALRASQGGRNLIEIGLERDIEWAADIDRLALVPQFHPSDSRITVE